MPAKIIDGAELARQLRTRVAEQVAQRTGEGLRPPGLAVVLVGNDPASHVYVRSKSKLSTEVGIRSFEHRLDATATQTEMLGLIANLNEHPEVDGILIQLPLPPAIDSNQILASIDPAKDVDGFHPLNVGRLAVGLESFTPCTPLGCMHLLDTVRANLSGLSAVVVGRSNIVGKPLAQLLLRRNCTVTIAHSHTADLSHVCRQADILIAAAGQPNMIRGNSIKPGALVIDVGINRLPPAPGALNGRLVGDVAFEEARDVAGAITPVPGGVGPMTIACLLSNTLDAAVTRAPLGQV